MKINSGEKSKRSQLVLMCAAGVGIPLLFALYEVKAHDFKVEEENVIALERKQSELVEDNKQLIEEISVLSASERIERLAENELGMHKASTDEIVRVEIKDEQK